MKKILHILGMILVTYVTVAQDQSEPQLFVGNAAVDYKSEVHNLQVQLQVGNPVFSMNSSSIENLTNIGFPYGVFYIAPSFLPNEGLEISKGYFTDKVNIKWTLNSNKDVIEKINIYRKELGTETPVQLIVSVSKDVFEFDDTQTEGGVLYEYTIEAEGVSTTEEEFITYIKAVGFRSPTATVSGSISYDGGSPVQDVTVFAEANGVANNTGSSLKFTEGYVEINEIEYDIPTNQLTLQTWVTKTNYIMSLRNTKEGNEIQLNGGKFLERGTHSIGLNIIINDKWQAIRLNDSYPTGEIDNEGNDVFENISSLTDASFIHLSAVLEQGSKPKLYLNGREITQAYIDGISGSNDVLKPSIHIGTFTDYDIDTTIDKVILGQGFRGGGYTGYLDEVRIWKRALSAKEIRRDFRRYLSGAETDLSIYLRMDEKAGNNVYDFSKKGFRQNKNDGVFRSGVAFSSVTPTTKQLGVFGVTDENGSYAIASIAYSGTGESFVISPSFGVHEFEPASQTVFLGAESSVVNQLNFKDISSFKFNGRAVYNVQNVFNSIPLDEDEASYTDIEDFDYNQYKVTSNGARITINKGQYYYEGGTVNPSNNFYEGGELKKYPVIGIEKAKVYIDGNLVINSDNQPVETDADGNFSITVPIGQHKIEVRKDGHTFVHSGFFPASDTFDFFENQISPRWFIDTTRISLIGKVVGGKIESEKPLGFGLDGTYSYLNNEGKENEENESISSKNNIGVATIVLKGNINTNSLDVSVQTNPITGEYKASLIPYNYAIKTTGLKIPSNTDLDGKILTSNETLNLLT